jgi:hypothetical protein
MDIDNVLVLWGEIVTIESLGGHCQLDGSLGGKCGLYPYKKKKKRQK